MPKIERVAHLSVTSPGCPSTLDWRRLCNISLQLPTRRGRAHREPIGTPRSPNTWGPPPLQSSLMRLKIYSIRACQMILSSGSSWLFDNLVKIFIKDKHKKLWPGAPKNEGHTSVSWAEFVCASQATVAYCFGPVNKWKQEKRTGISSEWDNVGLHRVLWCNRDRDNERAAFVFHSWIQEVRLYSFLFGHFQFLFSPP